MIHFFPKFADADASPFGDALRATGAATRVFPVPVRQNYRKRSSILFRYYPALIAASVRAARTSLFADPPPHAVVLSSDVEVFVFGLLRLWPGAAKARIVFLPFIFTDRASASVRRLRAIYYRAVMRMVSLAICHSRQEVDRYAGVFAGCGARFVFIPWGCHVPSAAEIVAAVGPLPPRSPGGVVVSAGKSGRDYPTLVAATRDLDCETVIVSNVDSSLLGVERSGKVEVLGACFGLEYLWQLLRADVVVVPLAIGNISAGQMVFIQAMALGRPVIVTGIQSVSDYLEDGRTALLVPLGDVAGLRAAIVRVLGDPALAAALGRNGQAEFRAALSEDRHLGRVVDAVEALCGIRTAPAMTGETLPHVG